MYPCAEKTRLTIVVVLRITLPFIQAFGLLVCQNPILICGLFGCIAYSAHPHGFTECFTFYKLPFLVFFLFEKLSFPFLGIFAEGRQKRFWRGALARSRIGLCTSCEKKPVVHWMSGGMIVGLWRGVVIGRV